MNITVLTAGTICCLGRVSARVCHLHIRFLVKIILLYTVLSVHLPCKQSGLACLLEIVLCWKE
jgi:hypothetical protein